MASDIENDPRQMIHEVNMMLSSVASHGPAALTTTDSPLYTAGLLRRLRDALKAATAHRPTEPAGERTQADRAKAARELRDVGREIEPAGDVITAIRGLDYWAKHADNPAIRVDCAHARDTLARFTVTPRAGRESAHHVLEGAPGRVRFLYTLNSVAAPGCAVIQLESVPVEIAATSPEEAIEIAQRARPLPEFLVYKVFRVTNTIDREGTPWTS